MKMRRKEKIILITALAGVVGLGIWLLYAWLYLLPEKAIERELAKIRARGEPVTSEELAPPEVPDAENAALIYSEADKAYTYDDKDLKLGDILAKDLENWTEEDEEFVRTVLKRDANILSLLREAAYRPKYRLSPPTTPPFLSTRHFANLLAAQALLKAKEGQTVEALEHCWQLLRLARGFCSIPVLISQMLRIAIDEIALGALEKVLRQGEGTVEAYRRVLKEVDIIARRQALTRALQCERRWAVDSKNWAFLRTQMIEDLGKTRSFATQSAWRIKKPFSSRERLFFFRAMGRLSELSKLPYHQAKSGLDEFNQYVEEAPYHCRLAKAFLPSPTRITGIFRASAENEARIGLAQLALALKIYKAEEGKYPDSLSELVPHILPELPKDPFTGKDFVYKKEAEGFLVYSLNEDGTDEGGFDPSDIPWRCKR